MANSPKTTTTYPLLKLIPLIITGTLVSWLLFQVFTTSMPITDQSAQALLQPHLTSWKAMRSQLYMLLALAMMIIGVLIAVKRPTPESPHAVSFILPPIVLTLIGVTFSYSIAEIMLTFYLLFL